MPWCGLPHRALLVRLAMLCANPLLPSLLVRSLPGLELPRRHDSGEEGGARARAGGVDSGDDPAAGSHLHQAGCVQGNRLCAADRCVAVANCCLFAAVCNWLLVQLSGERHAGVHSTRLHAQLVRQRSRPHPLPGAGQLFSTRSDLFPAEFTQELSKLQARLRGMPVMLACNVQKGLSPRECRRSRPLSGVPLA